MTRKFFSFVCLDNESNKLKRSKTEGTEYFPELPQRSESDVECGGGYESSEKRVVYLQVMPVGEVHVEPTDRFNVPNLTNVVENVKDHSRDDSDIIVSHLLSESLDVLDDSRLQQLLENAPVGFVTELEEELSTADVRGVTTGEFTENVGFLDNAVDLKSGNQTSTPSNNPVRVSGKRKTLGSAVKSGSVLHPQIVAFEIGYESDEECAALGSGIGRVNARKSCLSGDCPEKTLTEFGLSELEMMARKKAGKLEPGSHVVSSDGMVRVPTVGSSGGPPDVGLVRTKYYRSQYEKTFRRIF